MLIYSICCGFVVCNPSAATTTHRKRGFPEEWLAGTFAICSWGNGVVAILAGFLAQVAAGGWVSEWVDGVDKLDRHIDRYDVPVRCICRVFILCILCLYRLKVYMLFVISRPQLLPLASDVGGDIGPFQLAIGLTIVALVLIVAWEENYGDAHETKAGESSSSSSDKGPFSLLSSVTTTLALIAKYPSVLCLGLSQAFFEGGVYTFGESC
jgi:hypothetical protein